MPKFIDLTGSRIGLWTVLGIASRAPNLWKCKCKCGTTRTVVASNLHSKASKSCGCATVAKNKSRAKHSPNDEPEWRVFKIMHRRCKDPKLIGYENYGGRGITVCRRWYNFQTFLLDMGKKPTPSHSIDRINNDGNYEPGNCRWATKLEQVRNARSNVLVPFNGKTLCLSAWAELVGLPKSTIYQRIHRGAKPIDALELKQRLGVIAKPLF